MHRGAVSDGVLPLAGTPRQECRVSEFLGCSLFGEHGPPHWRDNLFVPTYEAGTLVGDLGGRITPTTARDGVFSLAPVSLAPFSLWPLGSAPACGQNQPR